MYKLKKVNASMFELSESFNVVVKEAGSSEDEPYILNNSDPALNDESLHYSMDQSLNTDELEAPLLSLTTEVKELIEDFIHECKYIDEFYSREKTRILNQFDKFYEKFLVKVSHPKSALNLDEDMKEHGLDGLGYSSSWARQFVEFYSRLSWLDGFAKINCTAMQKVLLKFDSVIFDSDHSEIYKKLSIFLEDLPLHTNPGCINERKKILQCVAKHYFQDNVDAAYQFCEASISLYKNEDIVPLAFLWGTMAALGFVLLFTLLTPSSGHPYNLSNIKEIIPIFRCTLAFIFTLLCCGVVITYLKEFRVNYVIIFNSNPVRRLAPSGMYLLAAILMCVWLFCMIGEVAVFKDYLPFEPDTFALLLLSTSFGIFLMPMPVFQSYIRFPTIVAMINCCFSPFSEVRFLEFFVADVMTSLTKPFIDIALITCWLGSSSNDKVFETGVCHSKMFWCIVAWYIPFHIRFWQCINKYFVTGDAFPHLVNAGKYFASIVMIWTNYLYGQDASWRSTVIGLYLFATIYSYIWDILMDWGLCRDSRMLRERILYPPKYYYFSSVTNFFLRFTWILGFMPLWMWPQPFKTIEGLTLFLAIAEIYRRAQWSLFRLENENINNYEKYRTVLEIPRLPRD